MHVLRASLRRSPSAPLLLLVTLVLFRVSLLFLDHVLLLFSGSLVWDSLSVASFLSVVFLAGCRIRILLLFSASASFQLCLPSVALLCYLCLPSFLSLGSLLTSTSVSLAFVPFDWFFAPSLVSSSLVLGFLTLFLLGHFFVSSVYWPCVVLVHFLRNSVESQFLHDGVLPLGRVISYGIFGYG